MEGVWVVMLWMFVTWNFVFKWGPATLQDILFNHCCFFHVRLQLRFKLWSFLSSPSDVRCSIFLNFNIFLHQTLTCLKSNINPLENNKNTRASHWRRSSVFVVNFEHISHRFLAFCYWLWAFKYLLDFRVILCYYG